MEKKISFFRISTKLEGLIVKFIDKKFCTSDSKYPVSICNTCRNTLNEHNKKKTQRPLPKIPNYADIYLHKQTRNNNSECNCYVCRTARKYGHKKIETGKGHVRDIEIKIDKSNGLYASSDCSHNVSLQGKKTATNNKIAICKTCFSEIKQGKKHLCYQKRATYNNLMSLVDTAPESVQENIAQTVIKRKANSTFSNCIQNGRKDINIKLKNLGNKELKVMVKPVEKKDVVFPVERLDMYQSSTGTSANGMRKLTNFLRSHVGRNCIEKGYKEHIPEKSSTLEEIYKHGEFQFDTEKSKKEKRPVVWADAQELVNKVITERHLVGNYCVKVMADGGQGFLKICLSIFPESIFTDENENSDEPEKKRTRYSDGGSVSKDLKLTSVYKTILLCIVPSVLETYDNLQILFNLTNINNISFKFVSDLKLLLTVNGQQTASSMFPCPYCFVSLKDLQYKSNDAVLNSENDSTTDVHDGDSTELKTYGHLKKDFEKYKLAGKRKIKARMCHSTVNPSLIKESDEIYILEKCIVPELHLMQGFVNHLFWDGLVKLVGREKALIWPKKLNVVSKNYQGDIFEGNACRKLLKEADKLNDSEITCNQLQIQPYISVFKAMNKVVDSCFSTRKVSENLDLHLEMLKKCFYAVPHVSETLKIHILLNHIQECVKFIDNEGLGIWSEQAGESIHHEFNKYWMKYKINSIESKNYLLRLKKAVVECSSRHI